MPNTITPTSCPCQSCPGATCNCGCQNRNDRRAGCSCGDACACGTACSCQK